MLVIDNEDGDYEEDNVMMDAMDCGADDFEADGDCFTIYTDPDDFNAVADALTKKGYTFEGWFNGEEKLTAETVISGDVIYTAQWSPITYTIAFSGGEGGQGAMDSIPATYDQEVTLPKNTFTRPGYYFNGWSTSSGASSGSYADEKPVKNLTTKQGETVTLYAAWYGMSVNVTLHPNYDGAENGTRTCIVGSNYNYILKEGGGTKRTPSAPAISLTAGSMRRRAAMRWARPTSSPPWTPKTASICTPTGPRASLSTSTATAIRTR